MDQEIQTIVEAIKSLKQESDIFKDYLFPILSAFFSAILGGTVAYLTFKSQESLILEKEKIINSNKWILSFQYAFANLQAIKSNYKDDLTSSDPIQRLFQIPTILNEHKQITEDLASLSFIAPKKKVEGEDYEKWSQLPLIGTLAENYNQLLSLWQKQSKYVMAIKEKLAHAQNESAAPRMNLAEITNIVGISSLAQIVDLTERLVILTDDLLIEINDFMINFPNIAKSKINNKRLKKYGQVLEYSENNNKLLLSYLERSPEVNYNLLSSLLNEDIASIKRRFSTGYS